MKHSLYLLLMLGLCYFAPLIFVSGQTTKIDETKEIEERIELAKALSSTEEKLKELKLILTIVKNDFSPPHILHATCYYELGELWLVEGKGSKAYPYYQKAQEMFEELESWSLYGQASLGLAVSEYFENNLEAASNILSQTVETIEEKVSDEDAFWGLYFNLGMAINFNIENYERAIEVGQKALAYYEISSSSLEAADVYNNLANIYTVKGDYTQAIDYYMHVKDILLSKQEETHELEYDFLETIYFNLGTCYYRMKAHELSKTFFHKALELLEGNKVKNSIEKLAVLYGNIHLPYLELAEYELALSYLQKADSLHQQFNIEKGVARTYHNLGYVHFKLDQKDIAKSFINKAIKIYGNNNSLKGKAFRHLGMIEVENNNHSQALYYFQESLTILMDSTLDDNFLRNPKIIELNTPLDIFKTLADKGRTLIELSKQGNHSSKNKYLKAALETFELTAFVIDSMRRMYTTNSKAFWNEEVKSFYEEAIDLNLRLYEIEKKSEYLEKAFVYSEKSKATLLLEALKESYAKTSANIPQYLLDKEQSLKIDLAFYQKQIFQLAQKESSNDSLKIRRWKRLVFEIKQSYNQLLKEFETNHPRYYQLKYEEHHSTISELQQKLEKDQTILSYFMGEKFIFAFYISPTAHSYHKVPITTEFNSTFGTFIQNLSDQSSIRSSSSRRPFFEDFVFNSYKLYSYLIEPIWDSVHTERLIIVPDGILGFLPFDVLIKDADISSISFNGDYSAPDYLLKSVCISYAYSASLFNNIHDKKKLKGHFLGFAPSYRGKTLFDQNRSAEKICEIDTQTTFSNLENNQKEIQAISKLYKGETFLGLSALEQSFKNHAPQYKILHLAMHAFVNHCDPLYSGLAFYPQNPSTEIDIDVNPVENEGFLYAYEIYNMDLNADLVALSACNTGIGQLMKGEGIMSLARAFKYAGASSILMSLWQADDKSTAAIMESFYHNLAKGMNKTKALQQAKLDYINDNSRNHPFYWSTFLLIGNDMPLKGSLSFYWFYLIIAVSILSFSFYGFKYLKSKYSTSPN